MSGGSATFSDVTIAMGSRTASVRTQHIAGYRHDHCDCSGN